MRVIHSQRRLRTVIVSRVVWLVALMVLLSAKAVVAAEPLVIGAGADSYRLGGAHLDVLKDPGGKLTIADVTSPEFSGRFRPNRQAIPNFGITSSAFWFRFTLRKDGRESKRWLLLFDQPITDRVDLYVPKPGGGFKVIHSGYRTPVRARIIRNKDILFPLSLQKDPRTFYLRSWIPGRAQMPMIVLTERAMRHIERRELVTFAFYGGIIVCFSLVAFFIYLLLHDRDYLYFLAYILFFFLGQLGLYGYFAFWTPPAGSDIRKYTGYILWAWIFALGLLFERSFLRTRARIPRVDIGLKWLSVVFLIIPLASVLSFTGFIRLIDSLMPVNTLLVMAAAVLVWRQGSRTAGYYFAARLVFYVDAFAFDLNNRGLLSVDLMKYPVFIYGSFLYVLFIVIAMSGRFRAVKVRLDSTLAELHREVAERTSANQALQIEMEKRAALQREVVRVSDNERRRFSQDLHDGLCQKLTGARVYCSSLRNIFPGSPSEIVPYRELTRLLNESVNDAYDLSKGMWPLDYDPEGGTLSLSDLCGRLSDRYGTEIDLLQEDLPDLEGMFLNQICRIAQEAIMNAIKHSKAGLISVSLTAGKNEGTVLRVQDDGVGMNGKSGSPGGLGIGMMRHRARIIGGKLEIDSPESGGTVVLCRVPPAGERSMDVGH